MELIKHINDNISQMTEDAADGAVGAGGIAANATPLFSMMVKRTTPEVPTIEKKKKTKKKGLGLQEAFDDMDGQADPTMDAGRAPSDPTVDATGVVAKLKGLEKKEKQDYRDTVSFGLEDDNGGIVRVTVKQDQAPEFEKALQAYMATDDDETHEIAEILFKLRDNFDIVDVQWPEVEEDEEQDVALASSQPEGEVPEEEGDIGMEPPVADESQAASVLSQVIDMMRADADARKAEARAREAEAKAKEADAVIQQATTKAKQEEQFLDMDTYNKAKKDEEREAKRLAQLMKWRHDMSKEEGMTDEDEFASPGPMAAPTMPAPEEEERTSMKHPAPTIKQQSRKQSTIASRVRPQDVANFILNRVK